MGWKFVTESQIVQNISKPLHKNIKFKPHFAHIYVSIFISLFAFKSQWLIAMLSSRVLIL